MSLARRLLWRLLELIRRKMEDHIMTGKLGECDKGVKTDDLLDTAGL
jgi:hypothetical protein